MSDDHSLANLVQELQAGESAAAWEMWECCMSQLVHCARRKLADLPRRAVDEEDVALSAFDAFLQGVKHNRFEKLENREDLWQILAMLTERRAIATLRQERAQKRGGCDNRGESVFEQRGADGSAAAGIDQVNEPSPASRGARPTDASASPAYGQIARLPGPGHENRPAILNVCSYQLYNDPS